MKKGLVIIGYDRPNRYSWAILMGYLEGFQNITTFYDFKILPFQPYEAPLHMEEFEKIPWSQYDVVIIAFSLMTVQMPQFRQFIEKKHDFFFKRHQNIVYIVGGPHVMAKPEEFAPLGVDFIIPCEGEVALRSLLEALMVKNKSSIETQSLAGVARGNPNYIPASPPVLIEMGQYPPFSEKFRLFGPIEISRGCPYRCKFCQTGNRTGFMRHSPVEQVVKWVKRASEIKFDKVWFLSPNAFAYGSKNGVKPDSNALQILLAAVKQIPKIKEIYFGTFPSEVRPEFVTREVLAAVVPYISNKYIVIGAQNASDSLLKSITRGHGFSEVLVAIDLLKEFGLNADIDFIFGLPSETEADIDRNAQFFEDVLSGKYPNVKIHTHSFMPLPGTPLEEAKAGEIPSKIQKIIGKLTKSGKAYGEHLAQAGLVDTKFSKDIT